MHIDAKGKKYVKANEEVICAYCGKPFLQIFGGPARFACYKQECIDAHKQYAVKQIYDLSKKLYYKRKLNPQTDKRLCTICGKPLPKNRMYRHDWCLAKLEKNGVMPRLDDDYVSVWA